MGTLHLVVNVLFKAPSEDWLPAWLVFIISLFLTLAPHDYVIYYQDRGLSGHTSPCGERVLSCFGATPGDWLPARLVFIIFYSSDPGTT